MSVTQEEIDSDQAGFISRMFPYGDPFAPELWPEGSETRKHMQEMKDKTPKIPLESYRMIFIDLSESETLIR